MRKANAWKHPLRAMNMKKCKSLTQRNLGGRCSKDDIESEDKDS
ncbi:hypothetical protein BIW11_04129 [Tropilaelaps mercedesae]|uniref:Uncharacterized protein n=1 Tax=Tropilaelaps mercedesae TaxID=418985 RepID=A0A1V9XAL1_9ACAR|nr:hypothetical protein BIW11_04129 [Tropilaelaps mercedesae]